MADRVRRTALIAGCVPLDDPVNRSQLPAADNRLARLSVRAQPAARAVFAAIATAARRRPKRFARLSSSDVCPADRAVFLAESGWFGRAVADALGDMRGEVDEYRVMVAPWGFTPEEVVGPVDLWQGDADTMVPPTWAVELKRRFPRATLTSLAGEGHLIAVTHRRDVLARLLE